MKKITSALAIVSALLAVSCSKNTEGNTGVLPKQTENYENTQDSSNAERTERYVAEDATSALVTFKKDGDQDIISIRSNNKTISAPEKEKTSDGGIYSNYDFSIVAKTDSVIITQGDNVIKLKKARGQ